MDPPQTMDYEFEWLIPDKPNPPATSQVQNTENAHANARANNDNAILDNQQQNINTVEGVVNSPGGGGTGGLLSDAKAQGIFSGFGSGARSQNIMSLGEKS